MQIYAFEDKLTRSKSRRILDMAALHRAFPRAVSVRPGNDAEDRAGADYIVEVRNGPPLRIDAKARERGCSKYWQWDDKFVSIPEVAIELVSVRGARTGWALDWSKRTDFVMFTFDPEDHEFCYVIPALAIRQMMERFEAYIRKTWQVEDQNSGAWMSQCVFVPINKVADGIVASWKVPYRGE